MVTEVRMATMVTVMKEIKVAKLTKVIMETTVTW